MLDKSPERVDVLAAMEGLDSWALACVTGGLMLLPENLHYAHRFEVLANMVLAGLAAGRGSVTRSRARKLIEDALGAWTGRNDDPWPNLAETFVYHGGTHLFIPGGIDTVFVLHALARAAQDHLGFGARCGLRIAIHSVPE